MVILDLVNSMKITEKIRMIREIQNLTQLQLAEKTHMSVTSYAKLERGERKITIDELERIVNSLNIRLEDLFSGDSNNILCFINSDSNQNINYYATQDNEIEKLKLVIANQKTLLDEKSALIEEQKAHIRTLQSVIEKNKKMD